MSILIISAVLVAGFAAVAALLVALARRHRETTLDTLGNLHRQGLESQLTVGAQQLEGKKELIDRELGAVRQEFARLQDLVRELEQDRSVKFGELAGQLRDAGRQTELLTETTQSLREALSSTKARGQWGERMAEDVLRLAGFVEGVQYVKQHAVNGGGIPDYTFRLPQDLSLHMDVKFPLDNYVRYLESDSELDRERHRKAFLRDVRDRLKELARRDYIGTTGECVDCVLLFIPNEQVYAFIQEQDGALLDDALRDKVVFCSPLTLFAVLAVVRQAVDNFRLEQTSKEILSLLLGFEKQWGEFVKQMDKVGRNLRTASGAFDELESTRRRQLERQLDRVEDLRRRELTPVDDDDEEEQGPFALEA